MRAIPNTILALFAHPDDEIGIGSTLAYYSDLGVFTVLVCASRGEAATIYCEDCATRENLAEVRTHELECAGQHLGVAELRWLDWPDGGIQALPREKAVRQVVALIREIQPDVIITHPETGLYPHPDHLAMWEIVREAYDAAANRGQFPETGSPWSAARLFTRGIPQSYFDAAPDFAAYRVELNGQRLPFIGTPDEDIDVVMQVSAWADRRLAGWDCHRSQHNPHGAFSRMPDGLRREMAETEHYVLVGSRVPLANGIAKDLLAGLDDSPVGEPAEAALIQPLRDGLAVRRGYLAAYQETQRLQTKPELIATLERLADPEQEFIYLLAGALRRFDEAASGIAPDQRVVAQALSCRGEWCLRQFLRVSARHTLRWCRAHAESASNDEVRTFWDELCQIATRGLAIVEA